MKLIYIAAMAFLVYNYNKHYMETKDTSLQGFYEYMKEKYWDKKEK